MTFQHVGLYGRLLREDIQDLALEAIALFQEQGAEVYVPKEIPSSLPGIEVLDLVNFRERIELLVIIGGDGTFLRAADLIKGTQIPLIGINKGRLGFLSEIEADELESLIPRLLKGDFTIDSRMMVSGEIWRDGEALIEVHALNDLVFNRDPMQNSVACEVFLDAQYVDSYSGDGMIFASPTGSTGYSLSASGPLIYPGTECMIVNPICPHQLGATKLIVPASSEVIVDIGQAENGVHFFADGRYVSRLYEGDQLCIRKSELYVDFIHVKTHPFFRAVHEKLLKRPHSPKKPGGDADEKP